MKRIIMSALLSVSVLFAFAQKTITGKVVDAESEEPIVDAQIKIIGESSGTVTNLQGEFSLEVPENVSSLIVSYVGFKKQTVEPTDNLLIRLERGGNLEEVIIQGVRAAKDDPVTQSVVDRKTLESRYNGEQPIFLLENLTPSIYAYSESGTKVANYGNLRLRGIGQERINMTLNGIPLNDMIDHGVFFSNFTDIGNNFESIQVQRGVGTSTNGAASYAGSINFESVNIEDREAGGEVQLGAGSFGTYRANASISTGMINDNWSFYGSYSRLVSDGYRDNTFTDARSFFFSGGYFGEKDAIKITAFDSRSKNGLGYSPVLASDLNADPTTNYLDENDTDDFGQQLVQIQHTHNFSDQLKSSASLYYGGSGGDFFFTYNVDSTTKQQINFPLYNDQYGFMTSFFWNSVDRDVKISTGIHAYQFDRVNEEAFSPDLANPYYHETSMKREFSWYGKVEWMVSDLKLYGDLQVRTQDLQINPDYQFLGVPSEGDISREWTFVNPKIGATYNINENLQMYASFGRTGREPTRIDIIGGFGIYDIAAVREAKQDDFEPEFVNNFEGGARLSYSDFYLAINYFYMDFENEIAPIGELLPFGVQKRANIPNSVRGGFEFELNYQLTNDIKLTGTGTYMKSGIRDFTTSEGIRYRNTTPILTPEVIGNLGIEFELIENLNMTLSSNYVGESYLDLSNSEDFILPDYFVTNFSFNYEWKEISLSFEANNLSDEAYYTNGAPVDVDFDGAIDGPGYLVNSGRNYFLTMKFSF
ncbi:MAG: TonB-dependent receptor [Fulvivirga sp.]